MQTLVCESHGRGRSYCRADTRFGVRLTHQLSRTHCSRDRTWGFDRKHVWVSDGCRAEFTLMTRN
jgi:hypothetical protein